MPEPYTFARRVNWPRIAVGGIAAGAVMNAGDYVSHRVILDSAWKAAFHALGKAPAGWWVVAPANFVVAVLMVWIYAQLRPRYGGGAMSALKSGLAIWAVFWFIPMATIMSMDIFPAWLLTAVIVVGFVEVNLGALWGAWLYGEA